MRMLATAIVAATVTSCFAPQTRAQRVVQNPSIAVLTRRHGAPRVADIVAGNLEQCARMTDETVRCWGRNGDGRLGDGTEEDRDAPTIVPDATDVVQLAVGAAASWALRRDGTVLFWGNNNVAWAIDPDIQLHHSYRATPIRGWRDIITIAAGDEVGCAITSMGVITCAGMNYFGELGSGSIGPLEGPRVVTGLPPMRAVAVGNLHVCAIDRSGRAYCWGANDRGQLGSMPSGPVPRPVVVEGLPPLVEVSAGGDHTCARGDGGDVWCWGANEAGQLGLGRVSAWERPARVDVAAARAIAVGNHHSCALTARGVAWCWGDNGFAQLATNVLGGPRPQPVRVDYASDVIAISAAGDDTCVRTQQDEIVCVGAPTIGPRRFDARLEPIVRAGPMPSD
jgi:alpha-tubulin suppressor-like RCC1 family protein